MFRYLSPLIKVAAVGHRTVRYWYCQMANRLCGRQFYYCVQRQVGVGLGNRLIGLANLWSWFGKSHIRLVWGVDGWVGERFENLFVMADSPDFKVRTVRINSFTRSDIVPFHADWKGKFWQLYVPPEKRHEIMKVSCLFEDTPQWALEKYRPFFHQLMPSGLVQARIDACPLPDDVVTVFISNSGIVEDKSNVCSLETIYQAMDQYPVTQKFFISCMNRTVAQLFHERYRGRCMELAEKNYSSMVDAVADMYLLGKGKSMIALRGSTFPEVAWWLGGGRIPVTKLEVEYNQSKVNVL